MSDIAEHGEPEQEVCGTEIVCEANIGETPVENNSELKPVENNSELKPVEALDLDKTAPFRTTVNIENFTEDEVTVKVRKPLRQIVIEAKHEENQNGIRFVSREFTRKFTVPERFNLNKETHKIENGELTVEIPVYDPSQTDSNEAEQCVECNKRPEFKAQVNIAQYKPEEISVNVQPDLRMISVEAKHMEKSENLMFIARQFTRKFSVPPRYKIDEMYHEIKDGVLSIHIPVDPAVMKERQIADKPANDSVIVIKCPAANEPAIEETEI